MAGHIRTICSGLDPSKFHITLACPPTDCAVPPDIRHIPVPVADRISLVQDCQAWLRIRRLAISREFDLVHAHGLKAALLTAWACRSKRASPLVITLHNSLPTAKSRWAGSLCEAVLRRLLSRAARIIVVSQAQADDLHKRHLAPIDKVTVIRNGVPPAIWQRDRTAVRHELGVSENTILVLMVGRLLAAKGVDDFLAVARMLRASGSFRFCIAGDGPDKERLTTIINRTGLKECVALLGQRSDMPDLLHAADVFVLPSISEGLPLSILEAMSAGLAVVATRVGGIPELVEHDVTGLLVQPGHPQELADAILSLANNQAKRQVLGAAGHRRWKTEFQTQRMLAQLTIVYRTIANADQAY